MTVTVAQLIEKLQSLPQDAVVRVLKEGYRGYEHFCKYQELTHDEIEAFNKDGRVVVDLGE